MSFTTVGLATTATLRVTFDGGSGTETFLNADDDPSLAVILDDETLETITSFVNDVTGIYSALWTPLIAGQYTLTWTFGVAGTEYTRSDTVDALDSGDLPPGAVDPDPDVGVDNTCTLTGTFVDSAGNFLPGHHVRFSPDLATSQVTGVGFVADDVTATSDANGEISFTAVRGLTGLLAVSGSSLVRRVTIPDQATIDIFELAATADDLLEIQEIELVELPRRS
jgi:hypothetical protein